MDHERTIRGIIASLESTAGIAETAKLTGAMRGGVGRAIAQHNQALRYLLEMELLDDRFFQPLPEDADFDEVGVACMQLSAFLKGYLGIGKSKDTGPMDIDINALVDSVLGRGQGGRDAESGSAVQ